MRFKKITNKYFPLLIAATILLFPLISIAAEVVFPISAYSPEELAKVRTWEKTWAGKKIDKSNIDEVAEFMPESYVGIYKDPDKWGAPPEGLSFTIVPYKQIIETKGMIEATKKYSPLVKTDENGVILNTTEIAGFPFPSPKTGLELAYNMDFQTRGDTYKMIWRGPVIDPKARTDRMSDQEFTEMYFIHRVEVDPKPAILKNPKGYHKGQFLHVNLPAENNNTRFISMRFIDETKPYSSYMFFAQYRRIQRMSQAERTNALDGTDMIYDDGNMWDGYLSANTYSYKGKKELLLARHQDVNNIKRIAGQSLANGYTFERCNTYVVEVVNKDPDYIYSKRIWYIDPETYIIHWQEIYDELGRFWKCFMQPTQDFKMENGEIKNFMAANVLQDFQRTHSGHTTIKVDKIGHKVSPKIFYLSNLQDTY
jgi:hypothetical protein